MHSGTDETCVTACFSCFRCTVAQMKLVWQFVSYVLDAQRHRWDLCDCLCFRCTVAQMKLVWQCVSYVLDSHWHRWELCDSLFLMFQMHSDTDETCVTVCFLCFRCTVARMRLVWQCVSYVLGAQWHIWDLCDSLFFYVLDAQRHRWDLCDSVFLMF